MYTYMYICTHLVVVVVVVVVAVVVAVDILMFLVAILCNRMPQHDNINDSHWPTQHYFYSCITNFTLAYFGSAFIHTDCSVPCTHI